MALRFFACIAAVLLAACSSKPPSPAKPHPPEKIVLWAWDRAEDLRFLKPGEAEVAALMSTLYLKNGREERWERKLPLMLPPGIKPIAVIRMESDGSPLPAPEDMWSWFTLWSDLRIQIDFDARESQRAWYRDVIRILKSRRQGVSITALASWCLDSPWFGGISGIEAVPMLFRMGPQRNRYLDTLRSRGRFAAGCRDAVGISTDEPLTWRPEAKRVYVFHPSRWTREAFDEVRARLR